MSQSKVSRIETGKIVPSVVDVERILKALQVPPEVASELIGLARAANIEYESWRAYASIGVWRRQVELKALTDSCEVSRHFLPAVPTGLLQIPDYIRALFANVMPSEPVHDLDKIVQARLDRQRSLEDESKRFVFLMTEQAVRWCNAPADVMRRQIAHMARMSLRSNIDLAVIPLSSQVGDAPLNIFTIYDDRLVIAELFSGAVSLREQQDVQYHLELFEFFYSHALRGDEATAFLRTVADEFMQDRD